ncbi:MAG: hypothetical protein JRD89_07245, partial [Deltaproteobacteria bacterium]|nr:hypothetical protein [Deltaproteobacteria bacterium]
LEFVVIGWDGVCDGGEAVPFAAELIMTLPDEVLGDILELSSGNAEAPEKNSETS